jgi:hypothetical protein
MQGLELATAYASADAFVYASETETIGNVVLEAMASGLGVIVPRAGGIPSLVEHGVTGFLYQPRRPDEMTSFVQQIIGDPRLSIRLSGAARRAAEQRSWDASIHRVRAVYAEAIAAHSLRSSENRQRRWLAPGVVRGMTSIFRVASRRSAVNRGRAGKWPDANDSKASPK